MVTDTWSSSSGTGNFLDGTNWSLGTAPAAGQTALIGFGQPNLSGATIDGFSIDIVSAQTLTATLGIANSTLGSGMVLEDTGSTNGQSMIASGTVVNNGTMLLDAPVGGLFNGFSLDMANPSDQLVNNGAIDVFNGDGLFVGNGSGGTLVNNGAVTESGARLIFNSPVSGTGTIVVNGVALSGAPAVDFEAPVGSGQVLIFGTTATSATIDPSVLTQPTDFGATVLGFVKGDTFDFINADFGGGNYDSATRVLEVKTLTGTTDIHFGGSLPYSAPTFTEGSDGNTGFLIGTSVVACFAADTQILTDRGSVPVERLREGDEAITQSGMRRQVIWIGHRHIDCRRHPRPQDVWPVRILAGAFGDDMPIHDLYLSPDHSVFIDGVLIPIRYLVNGSTIIQEQRDEVTYYHVELSQHDVILAEGLPCESYLDTGNRTAFANGGNTVMAHPDFSRRIWKERGCAEIVVGGKHVEQVRDRLLARAAVLGFATTDEPGVCVLADDRVLPIQVDRRIYRVRLPPGANSIHILSRSWVPAHMVPSSDDCRRLGVAIAHIRLDGQEMDLNDKRLSSGWHDPEQDWRWTDGDAGLALAGVLELTFDVAMTGRYWLTRATDAGQAGVRQSAAVQV